MSQYTRGMTASNLPVTVATQYTADDATTAVPAANNLNVFGFTPATPLIDTDGVSTTATGSTLRVVLTNRFGGAVTTTDATPDTSLTLALGATPGVYTFDVQIAGYDTTDLQGLGYAIFGTVRTTGAAASLVGTPDKIVNEENAPVNLAACDANLTVSGNSAVVTLTGIAAKTINWRVLATFVFVS